MAPVTDLQRRMGIRDPAYSQRLYEQITARAKAARRRDFLAARARGQSVEQIAQAAGLAAGEVRDVVSET